MKSTWIILLFLAEKCFSQIADSVLPRNQNTTSYSKPIKPEILTNGFVDVMNNGQMNASARLFKLYLGEPGKFAVPVSLYTGVSANSFNNAGRNNEALVLSIINPLTGVFNLSLDGTNYFLPHKNGLTKLGFQYQAGERLLSFTDMHNFQTITFTNSFANAGIIFQTGAWEKNKTDNMGMFWISYRMLIASTNNYIKNFLGPAYDEDYTWGFAVGLGIEITSVFIIKGFYYRYLGNVSETFKIPIFHFSFNYSMRY